MTIDEENGPYQEEEDERKGPWKTDARDFKDFQDAIKDVLNRQPDDSEWTVGIEVKKSGNPIHEYRIVLRPGG